MSQIGSDTPASSSYFIELRELPPARPVASARLRLNFSFPTYIFSKKAVNMTETQYIHEHKMEFLNYLHGKFPLFDHSNVFYRDLQYSMRKYMYGNGFKLSDVELEAVVDTFILEMVENGIFKLVSPGTWTLMFSDFHTEKPGKPVR